MHCSKCGADNPAGMAFCSTCGNSLQSGRAVPANVPTDPEQIKSHLVWAILATIFCCLPLGIVAIVNAAQVNKFKAEGDLAKAYKSSRNARMWSLISLVGIFFYVSMAGVLAAIAIPNFVAFQQKAYDSAAKADLMNLAAAEEAFSLDNNTYTDDVEALRESYFDPNPEIILTIDWADATGFRATARHVKGNREWVYDSAAGGFQE
jgi:Tfp pilus assembly protein PilE